MFNNFPNLCFRQTTMALALVKTHLTEIRYSNNETV